MFKTNIVASAIKKLCVPVMELANEVLDWVEVFKEKINKEEAGIYEEDCGEEEIDEVAGNAEEFDLSLIPKFNISPRTVVMMCGPSGSGKSLLSKELQQALNVKSLSSIILSSDTYRREVIRNSELLFTGGYDADAVYSDTMLTVSPAAFKRLELDLKTYTSFPTQTEVVIVDTTGMDERFRKSVRDISKANGYKMVLVTFEYKKRSDYYRVKDSQKDKDIVENSVIRFRRKVLANGFGHDSHDSRVRINSRAQFGWITRTGVGEGTAGLAWVKNFLTQEALDNNDLYLSCMHNFPDNSIAVIGDSHECVDELRELVDKVELADPTAQVIHIGDYLDKGNDTKRMVDLMYELVFDCGHLVLIGNHESYLYKRLKGQITPNVEMEEKYFTAFKVLDKDPETAKKFIAIFEQSLPFLVIHQSSIKDNLRGIPPVFLTHAPCKNEELAGIYKEDLTAQRNYRIKDREKPIPEEMKWLYEEAESISPLHIFGHVSHFHTQAKGLWFKNKVFLDTGAVYGGKLTALIVDEGKPKGIIQVDCKARVESNKEQPIPSNLGIVKKEEREFNIHEYGLTSRDWYLIKQAQENGIRHISGTMAPAPSKGDDIESFDAALEMFKKAGVKDLIVEPKYMGSRAQLYLFADHPEKTFLVSRGGWKVRGIDGLTAEEYQAFLAELHASYLGLMKNFGDMIIDGELMPWAALGKGLIEGGFKSYSSLVNEELETLKLVEKSIPPELSAKLNLDAQIEAIDKFDKVLNVFGGSAKPSFSPFKVLWVQNELETYPNICKNNHTSYTFLNQILFSGDLPPDRQYAVIRQNEGDWVENDVNEAKKLFNKLTVDGGMEGVVIKPVVEDDSTQIPYMKVRSKEYLRIVYGYNYQDPDTYARLCKQKKVSSKLSLSIVERNLAEKLLVTPLDNKDERTELIVKLIAELRKEAELDPRL